MVSTFLKRGLLLAVLSITFGLLAATFLDDVAWAMLAFISTFVGGIVVGVWRDRRIKKAFRENPEWSPRETVEQFRFGRRKGGP